MLSGKVTDTNQSALNGAYVYIPDLKLGAITDVDGKYTLKNIPNGTYFAVASFSGHASKAKEVTIRGITISDFKLNESAIELGEVIVTGVSSATEQKSNPIPVSVVFQK